MVKSNLDDFTGPEQSFFAERFPNSLSTEQKTAFVSSYSIVRVVRLITRFDSARFELRTSLLELQQASYNMAPRALG